jgi:hypothetical protein
MADQRVAVFPYLSASCGVPPLKRTFPAGSGKKHFLPCLQESASASVPTHSFKLLGRSRICSETGPEAVGPSIQIKVRQKRYKPPSHVPASRYLLDHGRSAPKFLQVDFERQNVALLTPRSSPPIWIWVCDFMTNRTVSLPTHYRLANAPSVIQRPCHLAWEGLRPVSGGVS